MGQGLYTILGYGVLNPPWLDEEIWMETVLDVQDLGLKTAYETEPEYLVIPLAIDEGFLQDYWHLPPLPDMLPHPRPRTAKKLRVAPRVLAALAAAGRTDLAATWREAQRLYAEAGLTLGEPVPIVLSDWD